VAWRPFSAGAQPGKGKALRLPMIAEAKPHEPSFSGRQTLLTRTNRSAGNAGFPPEKPMTLGKLMARTKAPKFK
jgi:hypothetical protein